MSTDDAVLLVRATEDDAEALMALKHRAFAEEIARHGVEPPGFRDIEGQRRAIRERVYYKVLLGGRLVGGVSLVDKGEAGWYVSAVYVDAGLQGTGVGTRAMQAVFAAHPEPRVWRLETPSTSHHNHRFYEKLGFVRTGEFTPRYAPTPEFRLVEFERPPNA